MMATAVRTTYLGNVTMSGEDAFKAKKQFSLTVQSTTIGTLLDGTHCKILLDSGTTKRFM